MDFLEKRIKEQRDELDQIERVDEGLLWQNIQTDLGVKKEAKVIRSSRFLQMYAVAASVAILILAGWILFANKNTLPKEVIATQEFVPRFEEEEKYRETVAEKKQVLNFEEINRSDYQDIFQELDLLENVHQEFKEDLPEVMGEERAVNVLQKYYERKLRILERLSKEIEKKSEYEKRINEKPM